MIHDISKYRQTLMGIAILGVMIAHCKRDWPVTIFSKLVGLFCYSVFTGGFLFLSGFGLYYSMKSSSNVSDFYIKRMKRLIIPWACLAIPYFAFVDIYNSHSWNEFYWHVSTLSFWKNGNYSGMWFISLLLILYLIYPIYHKIVFSSGKKLPYSLFTTTFILFLLEYILLKNYPVYFERIKVCMNFTIFFIGAEFAYASKEKKPISIYDLILTSIVILASEFILKMDGPIFILYNLFCIFIWIYLFRLTGRFKIMSKIIHVLEWFGLYTLELYMIHLFLFNIFRGIASSAYGDSFLFFIAVSLSVIISKPVHIFISNFSNMLEKRRLSLFNTQK